MADQWDALAQHVGRAMQYLKTFVAKDAKLTVLIRKETSSGEVHQFIGSETPHDEISAMLRAAADRHDQEAQYTGVGVMSNLGVQTKPKGSA